MYEYVIEFQNTKVYNATKFLKVKASVNDTLLIVRDTAWKQLAQRNDLIGTIENYNLVKIYREVQ